MIFFVLLASATSAQEHSENTGKKYLYWSILQLIPSPAFFQDSDENNARIQFGFKWNITPLSISFNPNKYVSPVQFFYIYPARRFSGSAELFVQPEIATSEFKYSSLSVFGISGGPRIILPLAEKGEHIAFSLGVKYTYRKNFNEGNNDYYGVEGGIYFLGGLLGLQYTQNFNTKTNYNFNLYIKYF